MKKILTLIILLMAINKSDAQENLNFKTPPSSILQLADYERAPSVALDTKK